MKLALSEMDKSLSKLKTIEKKKKHLPRMGNRK